jgi:MYXO-CTERM domain-containing protein
VLVGCLALAAGVFWHGEAPACITILPPASLVGLPANGDIEVPTDVVPFYDSTLAHFDASALGVGSFLLTSSGGDQVAVAAAVTSALELTPQTQLLPNTEYTLRGSWTTSSAENVVVELGFTTGAGPLSSLPPAPTAFLQSYEIEGDGFSSCGPPAAATCVALPADAVVEWKHVDASGQGTYLEGAGYLSRGPFFTNFSGSITCIQLRTRALNATYSDPVTLCGAGAPLVRLAGAQQVGCTPDGLTHDGPLAHDAGGGCGVTAGATPARSSPVWVLSVLAAISAMRRVRRTRRHS